MSLVLAMSIFFVIVTMIFVATALLLPEWMGITGSKAKEIIADHQQESAPIPISITGPTLDSDQKPT
jgi:hypothetical protein